MLKVPQAQSKTYIEGLDILSKTRKTGKGKKKNGYIKKLTTYKLTNYNTDYQQREWSYWEELDDVG